MNKRRINIILVVVAILGLFYWAAKVIFFQKKAEVTEQTENKKSFETTNKPSWPSPKSIIYGEQKFVLDENVTVYKTVDQSIDKVFMEKIAKSFGFRDEAVIDEETLVVYNNEEDNTTLDINKKTLTVKFSKNLLLYPMIKPIRVIPVEEIISKLKNLVGKNFSLGPKIGIKIERIEYETLAGPRFVTATKEKANIVKIIANYEIDSLPVYSSSGFPITGWFATDGNLLKLSVDMPFGNTIKQDIFSIKTEGSWKKMPASEYKIVDVDGGRDYDLASSEEIVEEVKITGGYLGYFYTPGNNLLLPYMFFKGNSRLPSGPAIVVVAIPALEEKEYYK